MKGIRYLVVVLYHGNTWIIFMSKFFPSFHFSFKWVQIEHVALEQQYFPFWKKRKKKLTHMNEFRYEIEYPVATHVEQ